METKDKKWYLANELTPAVLMHPGDTLGEELKARGIRQKDFAAMVGMQPTHLSALIHGKRSITPEVAAKLDAGLPGIPGSFWLRLQQSYDLDLHKQKTKLHTRHLVEGYGPIRSIPRKAALAEPSPGYGESVKVIIEVPAEDMDLLHALAEKMGWSI